MPCRHLPSIRSASWSSLSGQSWQSWPTSAGSRTWNSAKRDASLTYNGRTGSRNAVEASLSRCCKLGRNRSKDACRIICWTPSACARSSRSKTVFMQHGLGCQRLSPPPPPNRMSVMMSRLKTLLLRLVFGPLKRSLNAENEKLCDSVKKPLGCAKPHVLKVPRRHSLF